MNTSRPCQLASRAAYKVLVLITLLADLQSESLVSTCKSFCSSLTCLFYRFSQRIVFKKKTTNNTFMPISLTLLLKSLLVSLILFEDAL